VDRLQAAVDGDELKVESPLEGIFSIFWLQLCCRIIADGSRVVKLARNRKNVFWI